MGVADKKLTLVVEGDTKNAKAAIAGLYGDVNKLGGGFVSAFGGALPVISAVGTAIAGVSTVAVGAGVALFNLARQASDYGSQIWDAQQKTGLTAEVLSTLKLAADSSGSSFEDIGGSIGKFNVIVGQANQGSEKARATLDKYGITARDLPGALNQAIRAIAQEKDETLQAAAAKDLFKDRTGAVIPVVKQLDGDLQKATETARRMGTTLSQEDIKTADDLGDAIGQLSQQVKVGAAAFALAYGPQITHAIGEISQELADNKDKWHAWGTVVGDILAGVERAVVSTAQFTQDHPIIVRTVLDAATLGMVSVGEKFGEELSNYGKGGSLLRKAPTYRPDVANDPRNPFYKPPPAGTEGGGMGTLSPDTDDEESKAAKKREQERDAARKRELAAQKEHIRLLLDAEHDEYEKDNAFFEDQYRKRLITEEQYRDTSDRSAELYEAKAKKRLVDQFKIDAVGKTPAEIANLRLSKDAANTSIHDETVRMKEDREKAITGIVDKGEKERLDLSEKAARDTLSIERAKAETQKMIREQYLTNSLISEKEYARQVGQIEIDLLQFERDHATDPAEQQVLDQQIKQAQIRMANMVSKAIKDETKDIEDQAAAYKKLDQALQEFLEDQGAAWGAQTKQDKRNRTVGSGDAIGAMDQLREHFVDDGNTAAIAGIDAMATAFDGLGQALGSVISAWVLYGEAGQSVRQVTAQILAGVAQQAAVKAVFELAEGFAALALAFFGIPNAGPSASAHFTAAAIYGGIAGVAAIAGRGAAGNNFNQGGSHGSRGSSSGSGSRETDRANDPMSRVSNDAYMSGHRTNDRLAAALEEFNSKVHAAKPGDVFMRGMKANPGTVGQQVVKDIGGDAKIGRNILSKSGVR
jgi:hypothetical protein